VTKLTEIGATHLDARSGSPMDAVADDQSTASEDSITSDTSAEKGQDRQDGQDPVVPDHIKISAAPAVVAWAGLDGQAQHLSRYRHGDQDPKTQTTFDADADFLQRTALFRLRVPIPAAAPTSVRGRRLMNNLFLFIYPEHIRALSLVDDDVETSGKPSNTVSSMLGGVQVCRLRFELDTPCALVGPKDQDRDVLAAANEGSALERGLGQLQALASTTTFTVNVPSTTIPKGSLLLLCQSASQLTTMKRSSNLGSLYGGRGGMILPTMDALGVVSQDDSPPSYHELQQGRNSSWPSLKPGKQAVTFHFFLPRQHFWPALTLLQGLLQLQVTVQQRSGHATIVPALKPSRTKVPLPPVT
jgi:hypothetical protein